MEISYPRLTPSGWAPQPPALHAQAPASNSGPLCWLRSCVAPGTLGGQLAPGRRKSALQGLPDALLPFLLCPTGDSTQPCIHSEASVFLPGLRAAGGCRGLFLPPGPLPRQQQQARTRHPLAAAYPLRAVLAWPPVPPVGKGRDWFCVGLEHTAGPLSGRAGRGSPGRRRMGGT